MSNSTKALSSAVVTEEGNIQILPGEAPGLTTDQSEKAYGTRLHSLQMLEMVLLSGKVPMGPFMKGLETLAKYQFQPASHRSTKGDEDEDGVEAWMKKQASL